MTKEDYSKLKTPTKEELEKITTDLAELLFSLHGADKGTPKVSACPTCDLSAVLESSSLIGEMAAKVVLDLFVKGDVALLRSQLALMFVLGQLFQQQQVGAFNEVEALERMFKNSQEKI